MELPSSLSLLFLFLSLQLRDVKSEDGNITFIFMYSSRPPPEGSPFLEENTGGVSPAVDMALDLINEKTDLLSDYSLSYGEMPINSQCDSRIALRQFFDEIRSSPVKYFLLGSGCSIATENVGEIASFWEIITMSYASQSSGLSQKSLYRNFFRTVPSSLGIASVVRALFAQYSWNRIVVITQLEREFETIAAAIEASSLTVDTVYFQSDENLANTISFDRGNTRLYLLNMYPPHARRILCAAYRADSEMKYPRYVWLVFGWYPNEWWTESVSGSDQTVTCTDSQLKSLLDRSLVLSNYPLTNENDTTPTDVELTRSQFFTMYRGLLVNTNYSESYAAPFAYDALWAIALAMNNSIATLRYNLSQFDHKSIGRSISSSITQSLYNLTFTGVTGPVSFNANGTRHESEPRVSQYRMMNGYLKPVLIGRVSESVNSSGGVVLNWAYTNGENDDSVWPIIIPFDGTPVTEVVGIFLYVSIPVYVFGGATIIVAIIFAIVNFIFRKRKIIRLTSPNLNYLIVAGCILMSASGLFYSFPTTNYTVVYVLCYIRAYTQVVGYSLCFGTVCAKMWRVFFIFHNPTPKKRKAIKDWHLFAVVLILCIIDMVYISIALGLDRDYKPGTVEDRERSDSDTNDYGIGINYENPVCDSPRSFIWIGIVFFEKFLVQAAAVFFAIRTRKVKIKVLNDAKWISVIIYVTSFVLAVMLIGVFALNDFLNSDAAVYSAGLIIVSLLVLCILFIPKWYSLYKDPHGEKIFERGSQPSFMSAGNHLTAADHDNMVNHIDQLEKRLGKYEPVTPYQSRKRVLSSGSALDTNNPRMAALKVAGSREGRSLSYSPGLDVTASLPVGRLVVSPGPLTPTSPQGLNGSGDSGVNNSSRENSEDKPQTLAAGNGNMFTLQEEAEESNELKDLNDFKTESQKVLTFADELHVNESPF